MGNYVLGFCTYHQNMHWEDILSSDVDSELVASELETLVKLIVLQQATLWRWYPSLFFFLEACSADSRVMLHIAQESTTRLSLEDGTGVSR